MNVHTKVSWVVSCLVLFLALGSCGINSNIMFKVPKGDLVYGDSIPMVPEQDYKISIDDKLTFKLYANDGEILLLPNAGVESPTGSAQVIEYLVKRDGTVELPKIGNIEVEGLTVVACEDLLEGYYAKEYQDPFVQVKITNQRVVVFPGNGSDAKVILLENNNTTLMEAIAQAGGITERGKANTVKLMRRENGQRKVYVLDLSTIDGLKYVDMIVQANDYIYIEPNPQVAREVVKEVAPIISIISSAVVILTVVNTLK